MNESMLKELNEIFYPYKVIPGHTDEYIVTAGIGKFLIHMKLSPAFLSHTYRRSLHAMKEKMDSDLKRNIIREYISTLSSKINVNIHIEEGNPKVLCHPKDYGELIRQFGQTHDTFRRTMKFEYETPVTLKIHNKDEFAELMELIDNEK